MWHLTYGHESGRKLPTAYTSQQLQRWLRPKKIYFSNFFAHKKLRKIAHISQPTQAVSWVAACRNGCPKSSEILGPQTSGFEVSKIVLFVRFAEKSTKVRKVANPDKSWQILKNPKNPEKSQNRQKVDFWPKVEILAGLAGLSGQLSEAKKIDFFQVRKNPKNSENFDFFDPPKKPKKSAVSRGDRWSLLAAYSTNRRQKKRTFSRIFEGKGKKCPFFRLNARFLD